MDKLSAEAKHAKAEAITSDPADESMSW